MAQTALLCAVVQVYTILRCQSHGNAAWIQNLGASKTCLQELEGTPTHAHANLHGHFL